MSRARRHAHRRSVHSSVATANPRPSAGVLLLQVRRLVRREEPAVLARAEGRIQVVRCPQGHRAELHQQDLERAATAALRGGVCAERRRAGMGDHDLQGRERCQPAAERLRSHRKRGLRWRSCRRRQLRCQGPERQPQLG